MIVLVPSTGQGSVKTRKIVLLLKSAVLSAGVIGGCSGCVRSSAVVSQPAPPPPVRSYRPQPYGQNDS